MNEQRPILDQLNLVVNDMDASVAFYRRLGLDIPDTDPEWDPHHRSAKGGGLDFDLDSVAFARQWDEGWPERPSVARGGVIGFRFASRDAVDAVYADLTDAGYRGEQRPYDAFWGSRYAIVQDPDGNAVGLMSPRDPARGSMTKPPA